MNFITSLPWWVYLVLIIVTIILRDILQKRHTIVHNFPLIGHIRYLLESIGPELRQYIVANNREELPFNRRQRSWVYASSKKENHYQGFGTDQDIHEAGYIFIKPALMPLKTDPNESFDKPCPSAKIMGAHREKPYRPKSIINISAMSYGSLSAAAVSALNQGANQFGCYHNTGEGGLSPYHKFGSDVCFHFGTGYFGVRDHDGNFDLDKMVALVKANPNIKMIEVKLSQGAKPGKGGVLPGSKITKELAEIRHVKVGEAVLSPASHSAFSNIPELVDFVETIAKHTGLPVGIKAAVGKLEMWEELAIMMKDTGFGPDFITIDGGEGGTGAAPPSFADHVSLPWVYAFSSVYKVFQRYGLTQRITFIGSGKLGMPESAIMALSMGVDIINVAREALMSIGCIQAQVCHTNRCPTGIATNNKWLEAGLDPALKSVRFANYMKNLTKEIMEITHACGYEHPSQFNMDDIDVSMGDNAHTAPLRLAYGYQKDEVVMAKD
ncbi:FMN-binding glutamate synthase family protein [Arcticibacterium luteifluviistationis]|uniref:FMN-binding glutamate synthase family protein n=1 Tax=Arcticibacterium luteifluviistationis TaxID=1784714 RepID=A0A2Z4G6C6_9BACT|nr:FMN-binding glutamate synthase family protein [Arcticibacterium luteifluviistationis]AWV96686.1 FMN-binding glutamate synthase family protein [Arcticibacterium luteifluviistationis]